MTIIVLYILLFIIAVIVVLLHFSLTVNLKLSKEGLAVKAKYFGIEIYPRKKKEKDGEDISDKDDDSPEDFSDDIEKELDEPIPDSAKVIKAEKISENIKTESDKPQEKDKEKEEQKENEEEKEQNPKQEETKTEKKEKKPEKKKSSDSGSKSSRGKKNGGVRDKIKSIKEKYNKVKPYIPTGWLFVKKLLKTVRIYVDDVRIDVGREDAHEAAIYYGMIQGAAANLLTALSLVFTVSVKRLDVNCRFAENIIGGRAEITVRVRPSAVIAIAFCTAVKFVAIWLKEKLKAKRKDKKIKAEAARTA